MRSTPIEKMEHTANIPPLSKRRECKAMIQATKYKSSEDHRMNTRQTQPTLRRLTRSSFVRETKALQMKQQATDPSLAPPPWESRLENVTIRTSVPYLSARQEHNDVSKRALTLAMLEETYPQEAWIRAYTDGSVTDEIWIGGAGVYIQYPNGQQQAAAVPTGLHCTNYRAEVEALVHAANIISSTSDPDSQIVFLSVLEAANSRKLPRLQDALKTTTCTSSPHTVASKETKRQTGWQSCVDALQKTTYFISS